MVLVVALAPSAAANHAHVEFEVEETEKAAHQFTCIPEASRPAPGGACEAMWTGYAHPAQGSHVLDAFVRSGASSINHGPPRSPTFSTGSPIHRETGGAVPEILFPGRVWFYAWFGFWYDENANGVIDQAVRRANLKTAATGDLPAEDPQAVWVGYDPGNEFVPWESTALHGHASTGTLYGFVEPGSHPPGTETRRTDATQPDFKFIGPGADVERLHHSHTGVVILDGSLLEPYFVETVSDVVLVPDETAERPYRTTATSRVDVDVYATLAPGPVTSIYQTLAAPIVNAFSTPTCPNNCVVPPFPAPAAGPAVGLAFPRYERETEALDLNSASGRLPDFQDDWGAWLDILPVAGVPKGAYNPAKRGLPLASGPGGLAVAPATLLAVEAWSGAWKDLDRNGVIGGGTDPYEGGNRPVPHRYYESLGEFIAWSTLAPSGKPETFNVTLVPDDTWGPAGVFLFADTGTPASDQASCTELPNAMRVCEYLGPGTWFRERAPITLAFSPFGAEEGHVMTSQYVYFPEGTRSGGFTACSDERLVAFEQNGILLEGRVRDCDVVHPLGAS